MSRARRAAALALIALTITAAGCSRKSDASAPSSSEASARIVATAGFGGTSLLDAPVSVGIPVIDGLRSVTAVETAYGGGFVASMLGRGTETSPPFVMSSAVAFCTEVFCSAVVGSALL